jgi:hypothetical protein
MAIKIVIIEIGRKMKYRPIENDADCLEKYTKDKIIVLSAPEAMRRPIDTQN